MHAMTRLIRLLTIAGVFALFSGLAFAAVSPAAASGQPLKVFPPSAEPYDLTYGEWGAEWWQWRLEIPADDDPVSDPTGEKCAVNQSGKVWFLAGLNYGAGPTTRECEVPSGTSLLFPVLNMAYLSWPVDVPWDGGCAIPDGEGGCAYERPTEEGVQGIFDWNLGTVEDLSVTIDGVTISNVDDYRMQSPLFNAWLPEDNLIDPTVPEGLDLWGEGDSGPHAQEGWYLMTKKVKAGDEHEINFSGTFYAGIEGWEWTLDVTYEITVED